MKKLFMLVLVFTLVLTGSFVSAPVVKAALISSEDIELFEINGKDYVQTFYDDFDGSTLSNYWQVCDNYPRQNNYCTWDKDMTSLDGNGNLRLACDYDENGKLLTGAVRTKNTFYQKYGYFEIRVKLQSSGGFWSAFWLMPDTIDTGVTGGADGTEIDVYEAFDVKNKKINHAIHYDGYGAKHTSVGTAVPADVYDGEYHTFALDWNEGAYNFYIDGAHTYTIDRNVIDNKSNPIAISFVESYLKISLESGSWTGLPQQSEMPDEILVDYVKVYQRADYYSIQNRIIGDLNYDCKSDIKDYRLLVSYLAKMTSALNLNNTDVNRDGKTNAADALYYKKYLARIIDRL